MELSFDEFIAHLQNNRPAFLPFLQCGAQLSALTIRSRPSFNSAMETAGAQSLSRLADEFGEPDGEWICSTHYFRQDDLAQMIGARREVVSTF